MLFLFPLFVACFFEEEKGPTSFNATLEIWQPVDGALHIVDTPMSGTPIQSILSYQEAGSIHTLQLDNTELTASDIVLLAQAKSTQNLQYLSLKGNSVQNIGLQFIAESPFASTLKELDLSNSGVSNKGLSDLLNNPNFKPKKLILAGNSFHSSVLDMLADNQHIEIIDLSSCKLSDGAVALFLARTKARVVKLNDNLIGIPPALSPHIEDLYLYQTRLDDAQLRAFAKIEAKGLKRLFLGRIFVSYETLIAISHASWYRTLHVLSLNPRKQTEEEKETFAQSFGDHRWLNLNDPPSEESSDSVEP